MALLSSVILIAKGKISTETDQQTDNKFSTRHIEANESERHTKPLFEKLEEKKELDMDTIMLFVNILIFIIFVFVFIISI